jgi:dihydrofolate reductase
MTVTLILARANNGVIGNKGTIPWRIADDMQRFKRLTMGKIVVMGRRTWESLPKRPLPGRTNIVVTRDRNYRAEGATTVHSLREALEKGSGRDIMIAGGAEIYREALAHASCIELTEVHGTFEGDVTLEGFDRSIWREKAREDHATSGGLRYSYVTLERE